MGQSSSQGAAQGAAQGVAQGANDAAPVAEGATKSNEELPPFPLQSDAVAGGTQTTADGATAAAAAASNEVKQEPAPPPPSAAEPPSKHLLYMVVQFCYKDDSNGCVRDGGEFLHRMFATEAEALAQVRACNIHVHLGPRARRQVHPAVIFPIYSTRGLTDDA